MKRFLVLHLSLFFSPLPFTTCFSLQKSFVVPDSSFFRTSFSDRSTTSGKQAPIIMSASSNSETVKMEANLPPLSDLEQMMSVAITAAKQAGEIIVGYKGGVDVLNRKANSRDLLTEIDPLCEKTIRETILQQFPSHTFLGEEETLPGAEASAAALDSKLSSKDDYLWIVDPIDGTSNFVHGMPLCMPSIALSYQGEVVLGVIFDPHRKECFTAIKTQGAYLNNEKITVGSQQSIGDAIIAMGSPPGIQSMEMSLKGIKNLMPKCRTIRMLGSAAIMLAWVACGRLTVYWEYDLSSWDVAAGALLVTEAGGKFTDLEDNPYDLRIRKICASNGGNVHSELLSTLHESGVV